MVHCPCHTRIYKELASEMEEKCNDDRHNNKERDESHLAQVGDRCIKTLRI